MDDICDSRNLKSHLVRMNPNDLSKENADRNDQVFKRAVFSAVAGYTSRGLVGKVFNKEPQIEIPAALDYVNANIDGAGISLIQQSQDTTKEVIRKGRAGLFIDMAKSENGEFSRADLASNFATVSLFSANQIINWRTMQVGSQIITSQVVLAMTTPIDGPDGFSFENVDIRLELKLTDIAAEGESKLVYNIVEWRKSATQKEEWVIVSRVIPTKSDGQTLDRIPFIPVGSEANTLNVDHAPMYDIARVNQGHWNNSAIYEDSVFIVGQAQPWMSGLTQDMIDLFKTNNMYIGSGRMIGVPVGETFGFAQAEPNQLAKEAMDNKLQVMIGLGAMIIQPGTVAKTAAQSSGELLTQHSVLSLISSNISEAYADALQFVASFMGTEETPVFELNQDFIEPEANYNMLREMIVGFMGGSITVGDYHSWMIKNRLTDPEKTVEEFSEELNTTPTLDLDEE